MHSPEHIISLYQFPIYCFHGPGETKYYAKTQFGSKLAMKLLKSLDEVHKFILCMSKNITGALNRKLCSQLCENIATDIISHCSSENPYFLLALSG